MLQVCDPDLLSLNQFMKIEQRYTTVALMYVSFHKITKSATYKMENSPLTLGMLEVENVIRG